MYHSVDLDVDWTLVLRDGQLVLHRPRFAERTLATTDRDAFRFEDRFEDVPFAVYISVRRGVDGRPSHFLVTTRWVDNLEFVRVQDWP